ncbi:facilitated trehalose transporter Tret1-like [Diprion similis]|uniref:facilitated trehalose transporter Tret1-like n=1 Tax=Diprion similis TaxID=362088 RepID=UPI001EF7DA29|nr:facilitated trehalose transporter Tret1-like [Diprion similis]
MGDTSNKGKYTNPEGSATWEYLGTLGCALVAFCVGCVCGWSSPSLAILTKPDSPIFVNENDASIMSSVTAVGHMLAPTVIVLMTDRLGRRLSLVACCLPILISFGLIIAAKDSSVGITDTCTVLSLGRFFGGLSIGFGLSVAPMYLGEIASPKLRGTMAITQAAMASGGSLFISTIGPYLSLQATACVALSVAIVTLVAVWFVPESPYFLVMVGKVEEAESTLEKLRGKTDVSEEMELIKKTVGFKNNAGKGSEKGGAKPNPMRIDAFKQLVTVSKNLKALTINFLFAFVHHFSGFTAIAVFGQIIFTDMKTHLPAHICFIIFSILQFVSNFLSMFVIDRIGRRPLTFISGIISGSCFLIVGIYFWLMEYGGVDVASYSTIPLSALLTGTVALNIGMLPVTPVIQSETLDTDIKAIASCLVGVGSGLLAAIILRFYLMVTKAWKFGHSVPFTGFSLYIWFTTALILKLLPETKGRTFLEIQRDLAV